MKHLNLFVACCLSLMVSSLFAKDYYALIPQHYYKYNFLST